MVNASTYVHLAIKIATQMWHRYPFMKRLGTIEDVTQEAVLMLYEIAKEGHFDASRGCFSTYLTLRLWTDLRRRGLHSGVIKTALNSNYKKKEQFNAVRNVGVLTDEVRKQLGVTSVEEGLSYDVSLAIGRLPVADQLLISEWLYNGKKQSELAVERGVTRTRIGDRLKQIKQHLAQNLEAYAP